MPVVLGCSLLLYVAKKKQKTKKTMLHCLFGLSLDYEKVYPCNKVSPCLSPSLPK
jgi:hypothetical protein